MLFWLLPPNIPPNISIIPKLLPPNPCPFSEKSPSGHLKKYWTYIDWFWVYNISKVLCHSESRHMTLLYVDDIYLIFRLVRFSLGCELTYVNSFPNSVDCGGRVVPGCYAYLLICVLPCGLTEEYKERECQFICEALGQIRYYVCCFFEEGVGDEGFGFQDLVYPSEDVDSPSIDARFSSWNAKESRADKSLFGL